ncbi:MAG: transcriptional regulator, partial [Actinomycetota bacterium]|nr:transcriptional regulator [Actinomycetota bacterium]
MDALADGLKSAAAERGQSVNAFATAVLGAAIDPDLAGAETERVRERLLRAGLLAASQSGSRSAIDPQALG